MTLNMNYLGHDWYYQKRKREEAELMYEYEKKKREEERKKLDSILKRPEPRFDLWKDC